MAYTSALPIAWIALRILIVMNRLWGIAVLGLLIATLVAPEWTFTALGITPDSYIRPIMVGLQAVAVIGLVAIVLNDGVLRRLSAMVETVRAGDPFIAENAYRLQTIAWFLLALQLLSLAVAAIGRFISTAEHPIRFDAGFSVAGWLAVLLTFVLARVFAEGALMRDDLEGTV